MQEKNLRSIKSIYYNNAVVGSLVNELLACESCFRAEPVMAGRGSQPASQPASQSVSHTLSRARTAKNVALLTRSYACTCGCCCCQRSEYVTDHKQLLHCRCCCAGRVT